MTQATPPLKVAQIVCADCSPSGRTEVICPVCGHQSPELLSAGDDVLYGCVKCHQAFVLSPEDLPN